MSDDNNLFERLKEVLRPLEADKPQWQKVYKRLISEFNLQVNSESSLQEQIDKVFDSILIQKQKKDEHKHETTEENNLDIVFVKKIMKYRAQVSSVLRFGELEDTHEKPMKLF
ncbi:hypothetical protein F7734_49190 [Scytonema sp. UIC 10036]|uniref:hypothetical protein n=1 Tax=Scytonema sp. UIC 10036 TaxID=2304196 RepID=UPI0012DA7C35|nr:hypothetical protein [Scytonema sp. UIC 10036]MUG99831.1 hypothetical protein [Scytonema sp. UIC 10036]